MPILGETPRNKAPATDRPGTVRTAGTSRVRLGDELPIFCERCGYSLHGLAQVRCERCDVLHYSCPECNHHQPINTLRPAAQLILGRVRAFALGLWVFFKLNYFGWLLFAWFGMGMEWSYQYHWVSPPPTTSPSATPVAPTYVFRAAELNSDTVLAFVLLALPFSMVGRMLLLRWRRGWAVGCVLGALVAAAVTLGGRVRYWELAQRQSHGQVLPPLGPGLVELALLAAAVVVVGAVCVWPAWMAIVHLFLPQKTAAALLDWQRGLSGPETALARE